MPSDERLPSSLQSSLQILDRSSVLFCQPPSSDLHPSVASLHQGSSVLLVVEHLVALAFRLLPVHLRCRHLQKSAIPRLPLHETVDVPSPTELALPTA
ncbi:unnamed protein product [Closterium sp. NIES-53]